MASRTGLAVRVLLACVLTFALFASIATRALLSHAARDGLLQRVIAHEAAQALRCEVGVAPIDVPRAGRLRLQGLAVAGGERLSQGVVLSVGRTDIAYGLRGLIRARGNPLSILRSVEFQRIAVEVIRDADGKLNLPEPAPGKEGARGPAITGPGPRLTVAQLSASYTDLALPDAPDAPLIARFDGKLNVARLGWLLAAAQGSRRSAGDVVVSGELSARAGDGPPLIDAGLSVDWQCARLTDLRLQTAPGLAPDVDVSSVVLEYDPSVFLKDERPAVEALRSLAIDGRLVRVVRDADGQFAAVRNIRSWLDLPEPTEEVKARPTMQVQARLDRAIYEDSSPAAGGELLKLDARDIEAKLELARLMAALDGERTKPAGELSAKLSASFGGVEAACEIQTDLTKSATVTRLVSTDRGAELASAERLVLEYDLARLAGGDGAGAIRTVEADSIRANVTLDEKNYPTFLPKLVSSPKPQTPAGKPFAGKVSLKDASLVATLNSVRGPKGPLSLTVSQANAELNAAAITRARGRNAGRVSANVAATLGSIQAQAKLGGTLGKGFVVDGLYATDAGSEILWVDEARVDLDCSKLMSSPQAAVSLVSVNAVRARVQRDADGQFAALRSLPGAGGSGSVAAAPAAIATRLRIGRGDIAYSDAAARNGFRNARVANLSADLNVGALLAATKGRRAGDIGTLKAQLSGAGPGVSMAANASADLSRWFELRGLRLDSTGPRESLALSRARLDFTPAELFAGRLSGLRGVTLENGRAQLVRESSGQLRLAQRLAGDRPRRSRSGSSTVSLAGFGPRLTLRSINARLTDYSAPEGPVVLRAEGLNGTGSLSRARTGTIKGDIYASSPTFSVSGRLSTDLASRGELARIRLHELTDSGAITLIRAENARAEWSIGKLLAGAPEQALRRLSLRDVHANLKREDSGQMRIERLARGAVRMPEAPTHRSGAAALPGPTVDIENGSAHFAGWFTEGVPVQADAEKLQARVDLSKVWAVRRGVKTTGLGQVRGRVKMSSPVLAAATEFDADLDRRMSVASLHIDELRDAQFVRVADLPAGTVEFTPAELFGDKPLAAFAHIGLERPNVDLERGTDGELVLAGLVQQVFGASQPAAKQPDWTEIGAGVRIADGRIKYVDHALAPGEQPLVAHLTGLNISAERGHIGSLLAQQEPSSDGKASAVLAASWPGATVTGQFSSDMRRTLALTQFALNGVGDAAPHIIADKLVTQVSLGQLFSDSADPARAVRLVSSSGLDADITRNADGEIDLVNLFVPLMPGKEPGARPKERPPITESLVAMVKLKDSLVHYTDYAINSDGPVEATIDTRLADLDLAQLLADQQASADPSGELAGTVHVSTPHGSLSAGLASSDLGRIAQLTEVKVVLKPSGEHVTSAESVDVTYDLASLLDADSNPARALHAIHVASPEINAVRQEDGTFNIAQLTRGFASQQTGGKSQPSELTELVARASVADGSLDVLDECVPDGPVRLLVADLNGDVDMGRFWKAREGGPAPDIGQVRGHISADSPTEHIAVAVDWDLSERLKVADVAITQREKICPVLLLDRGTAEYDVAQVLGVDTPSPAALTELGLGKLFVCIRRQVDGSFELPRIPAAYMEEFSGDTDTVNLRSGEADAFLFGLRAHVQTDDLRVMYEDLGTVQSPVRAMVNDGAVDVYLDRLAALHDGREADSPGKVSATISGSCDEIRANTDIVADLGGRVVLRNASLRREPDDSAVLASGYTEVIVDTAALLSGAEPLPAIQRVTTDSTSIDFVIAEDGRWELEDCLRESGRVKSAPGLPPQEVSIEDFSGIVKVSNTQLSFRDNFPGRRAPALRKASGAEISGRIDFGAIWKARKENLPLDPGSIQGQFAAELGDLRASLSLDTDLSNRATLSSVSVTSLADGVRRELLVLDDAKIRAGLSNILAGQPASEQLRSAQLQGLRANVLRDEEGALEIQRLLGLEGEGQADTEAEATLPRLAGLVDLQKADITYDDRSLGVEGGLLVGARDFSGRVDLAALQALMDGDPVEDAGKLTGLLVGHFGEYHLSGNINADLARSVNVERFLLRKGPTGPAAVQADRAFVEYQLQPILEGKSPAAHVMSVLGDGLRAEIIRNGDGSLEIAQGMKLPPGSDEDQAQQFAGTVRLANSHLRFIDHSVEGDKPLDATLSGLSGQVDVGALNAMRRDGVARDAGSLSASVSATMDSAVMRADIEGDVSRQLTMTDLEATVGEGGDEDTVSAQRVRLDYELAPILAGQPVLEHLSYAGLHDLTARLTRETDGELRAVRTLRKGLWPVAGDSAEGEPQPLGLLKARVALQRANVQFTDYALIERGPLVVSLSDASADLDLTNPEEPAGVVYCGLRARTRTQSLSATLGGELDKEIVLANLRVTGEEAQEILAADRASFTGRFGSVFGAERSLLSVAQRVELTGLRGTIIRDADGKITSPEMLSFRAGTPGDASAPMLAGSFNTWVVVRNVDLRLEDDGALGVDGPLSVRLSELEGSVLAKGTLGGDDAQITPTGSLRGKLLASTPETSLATEFETDLVKHAWLRGLRSENADGTELANIGEAYVQYDLDAVARRLPPYEMISDVRLRDARASIGSSANGRLTVAGLPIKSIQTRPAGVPASAGMVSVGGEIHTDAAGRISGEFKAGGEGGVISDTLARFTVDPADGWLDATYSVGRADLPLLGRLVLAPDDGAIIGGELSASGFAYGRPFGEKDEFAWTVNGSLRDAQATLTHLGDTPVSLAGPFKATSEGVSTEKASLAWAGLSGALSGGILDLTDPVFALQVEAQIGDEQDLVGMLPEQTRKKLSGLSFDQGATLFAQVTGPVKDANAEITLRSGGKCVTSVEGLGDIRAGDVELVASVAGTRKPSIRATGAVSGLAVVRGETPDAKFIAEVRPPDVNRAEVRILSAGNDVGRAHVSVPWANVRGITATDVTAGVRLGDHQVDITGLQASVLGGQVQGAGVVDTPSSGPVTVRGKATLDGIDLAALEQLDSWPADLSVAGQLRATLSGSAGGPDAGYGADITVADPCVNGKPFEQARALIAGRSDGVDVKLAQITNGRSGVWLRGGVRSPDGKMPAASGDFLSMATDLELAAADVRLRDLPIDVGGKSIGGTAYMVGRVHGPLREPDVDAFVQVFGASQGEWHTDAVSAHIARTGDEVSLDHLLVSAGTAVVGVTGAQVEGFALRSDPKNPDRLTPNGTIRRGLVQGFGSMEDLLRAAGTQEETGGWMHMSGALSGTVRRPTVTCLLRADHVQLGDFLINEARLPVSVRGDVLTVSEGYLRTHGADLSVMGRMTDLYDERKYNLVATMPGLAMEDLPPVHRLGLDVSGMAYVPQLTLWGSRSQDPAGGAIFRMANLKVGAHRLEPVTGWLSFGGDVIKVQATRIRQRRATDVAASRRADSINVSVAASFGIKDRFLDADIRVTGPRDLRLDEMPSAQALAGLPDIGGMMQLAAPVVAVIEAASEAGSIVTQVACPPEGSPIEPLASSVLLSPVGGTERAQPPASETLARIGLRASGKVAGQVRVVGPLDQLSCNTRMALWNAELDGKALPQQVTASLSANLATGEVYGINAEAIDGSQYCMVSGDLVLPDPDAEPGQDIGDNPVDLVIEGADIDLPMWRQWLPRGAPVGGSATFLFVAKGDSTSPRIKGSVDILKPSYAGAQFDILKLPFVEVSEGSINVKSARLIRSEEGAQGAGDKPAERISREVAMEGSLPWTWREPWIPPDGEVNFRASLDGIDLGFFPTLLDEIAREQVPADQRSKPTMWARLETNGTVSAGLEVGGNWEAPELRGQVLVKDGSIRAPTWQRPVEDLQLDVKFVREGGRNRGEVKTARCRWGKASVVTDSAWAYLDHLGVADLGLNEYHADISVSSSGPMDVNQLAVDGLSGGVSFHTKDAGTALAGTEPYGTHVLALKDLTAKLGPGALRMTGTTTVKGFSVDDIANGDYDISLLCDEARLRYGKRLRGQLDGAIKIDRPDGSEASGDDRVRVDGEITLSNAEVALAAPKGGGKEVLYGLPRRFPSPVFDVRVNAGDRVQLRGMGMTIPFARSQVAHVTGTLYEPRIVGGLSAKKGAVRVAGGALQINGGMVAYQFGPVPSPLKQERTPLELTGEFHAEAQQVVSETEIPGWGSGSVEIFIAIDGELPNDFKVRTWSVPPLSEQQIFGLLGSQPLSSLRANGRSFEEVLSEQALNVLAAGFRATIFEPIESELMRIFGLSEFSIGFGFDQDVEVKLGKYLIKDLLVSYQRVLGEAEGDHYALGVSYRLKNRLRVAYTTDDRSDGRIKLSYDIDM